MRGALFFGIIAIAAVAAARTSQTVDVPAGTPAPPVVVGQSEKICQLDGETDWASGRPTAARTMSRAGLDAADLGYPVEHAGKLLFFFGDSWPANHPGGAAGEIPPDDALGMSSRTQAPDGTDCAGMAIVTSAPKTFARVTVTGPVTIHQGYFNVPSGAVSAHGSLYAFFWTNHCDSPANLSPSPDAPLARPAPTPACPETDSRNSIGDSVLAQSSDDGRTFTVPTIAGRAVAMPIGFVYTIAVDAAAMGNLPAKQRLGMLIFGVPRYRASVPYLAYAPVNSFTDPSTWKFFAGESGGEPTWISATKWAQNGGQSWQPPANAALFAPDSSDQCIGEFSVTWNRPLHSWLMLYNCGGIEARVANAPWGPWSAPTTLISYGPSVSCSLLMAPAGCGTQRNFHPKKKDGGFVTGGFYAPFVMNRYTSSASGYGGAPESTIYWLVSTWNPYEVVVMRTTLSRSAVVPRPSLLRPPHPITSHPI